MNEHPIEGLMRTSMQNIKEMVDVNTILGDPVQTPEGSVIIPISRVSFGFAAGGSQFESANTNKSRSKNSKDSKDNKDSKDSKDRNPEENSWNELPFGGGSGAGITINPVAFLVVGKTEPRLMLVESNALVDRILDSTPKILDKVQQFMNTGASESQQNDEDLDSDLY